MIAAALALGLLLAACSSSSKPASSSGAASTTSKTSAGSSTTAKSAGTVSETCPTASAVSSALGAPYPAPQSSGSSGTVSCNYSDPSTGANLVIVFSPAGGTSASTLKEAADAQAQGQHTTASAVAGLGDAAYMSTLNDASTNSSHVATAIMTILDGSTLIAITAQATPAQVKALASHMVGS